MTLGFGVQTFAVFGDLLDANGDRYDYTDPTTIPDGSFETELNNLGTETSDGYRNTTFNANLGLGIRFRITKSIEIFAQSDFKRAATDYLDDIAGDYRTSYDNDFQAYAAQPGTNVIDPENRSRGFENGNPDWYIYHGIGIKFSFGANKEAFNPPVITQRYTYVPTELSQRQLEEEEKLERKPREGVTNNYFTIVQLPSLNKATKTTSLDSVTLANNQLMIDSLETTTNQLNQNLTSFQNEIGQIDEAIVLAENDINVSDQIKATRLQNFQQEKTQIENQRNGVTTQLTQTKFTLDSIKAENLAFADLDPVGIDSIGIMNELLIYPGQVSRILYSTNSSPVLQLDTLGQSETVASKTSTNSEMMSREEFDKELEKFRTDMLDAQAKRDSAMMMAFATRSINSEEEAQTTSLETEPQELTINQETIDNKTAKKVQKNQQKANKAEERARKRQEKLEEKNNELLKDALLIGGTAAATAAITSNKKDTPVEIDSAQVALAYLQSDSLSINRMDSTSQIVPVPLVETRVDTVMMDRPKPMLYKQAKIEVYFAVNETELTNLEVEKLAPIKDILSNHPDEYLELVGFADNTVTISYNLKITNQRVASVKKALVEKYGIPEEKIKTSEGGLIVRGDSTGSRDQDRKVEIRIIQ